MYLIMPPIIQIRRLFINHENEYCHILRLLLLCYYSSTQYIHPQGDLKVERIDGTIESGESQNHPSPSSAN